MTNRCPHFITAALIACALVATARAAEPGPEEKAVQQSAQAFTDAFNKADAAAIAALWTPDGDYEVGGDTLKGREAIQKTYEAFFASNPGAKMQVKVDSVRLLAPTVAVEQGTAAVGGSPNTSPTASAYTAVHVKQKDGKWLMATVRESEAPTLIREDRKELSWLIGNWTAKGDAAEVDISYEWIANNNFIRGETKVRHKADGKEANGGTQIIGRDPLSGQIVSWFFNADGGHGYGAWLKDGNRWLIESQGATAGGETTTATNMLYHADDNVMSWQSVSRTVNGAPVPSTKEIVIERVPATTAAK